MAVRTPATRAIKPGRSRRWKGQGVRFLWPDEGKRKGKQSGPYEAKDIETSVKLLTKLAAIYESEPTLGGKAARKAQTESSTQWRSCRPQAQGRAVSPRDGCPRAFLHGAGSFRRLHRCERMGSWRGQECGRHDFLAGVRCQERAGQERHVDGTGVRRRWKAARWRFIASGSFSAKRPGAGLGRTRGGMAIHVAQRYLSRNGRDVPRTAGGYSEKLGWTGQANDKLSDCRRCQDGSATRSRKTRHPNKLAG